MTDFRHLHIHSYYSMTWGTAPIEALAKRLRQIGQDVFPLTDRNGVYGMIEHLRICAEHQLKPIIGCELTAKDEQALCLVKTEQGYRHLCALLTEKNHHADWRLSTALSKWNQGLAVITQTEAIIEALLPDGDVYIDLFPGGVKRALELRKNWRAPLIVTSHAYMISEKARPLHLLLRAIDLNAKLSRLPERGYAPEESCLIDPHAMAQRFAQFPEALRATRELAEACVYAPTLGRLIFPPSDRERSFKTLRDKTYAGLARRYGKITQAIRERADYELDMIRRKRFSSCFLVIEDVVSRFSLTCGRGSAAASIVSYALDITHVDPIKHDLFFERFLNPGRQDPPDIDVDFAWDERDKVRDYLWEKYGGSRIGMVCNHNRFRLPSAIREVAKVYGLSGREISEGELSMARAPRSPAKRVAVEHLGEPWPEIMRWAQRIVDYPRHISVHCGGVVIAPDNITHHCPLQPMPIGYDVVPWDKDGVEEYGFVKLDFLGNRSLAVIRDCLASIRENYNVPISYAALDPIDDLQTQSLIRGGDTMGCFYIESPATRQLLQKVGMGDYETLVAVSSIIRPAANVISAEWIRRHRRVKGEGGAPNWPVIHPKLEATLAETHGLMVYQEDVMRTAMALAGFDSTEGDALRKIVSKKHKKKMLRDYRRKFYEGCRGNGLTDDQIDAVWHMTHSFEGYSFCKPHSASYAMVSFKAAFLKFHYPAEFMAAVISNQGGFYSTEAYLSHAKRMGMQTLGPDANESRVAYWGKNGRIRMGLMQIKGLRRETMRRIVGEREQNGPYLDLVDFLHRVKIGLEEAKRLILSGCFDELEPDVNRPTLIWRALHWHARHQAQAEDLFPDYIKREDLPVMQPYGAKTLLALEKRLFGFWLSRHPLEVHRDLVEGVRRVRARDLPRLVGRRVTLIGWLVTGKTVTTKDNEPMCFLTFEDETGLFETVMFPELFKRRIAEVDRGRPFIAQGSVASEMGATCLNLAELKRLAP